MGRANKVEGRIGAPAAIRRPLAAFLAARRVRARVAAAGTVNIRRRRGNTRRRCTSATLFAGGWIACADAREAAGRLGITTRQMGGILEHLNVKIRACGLGCF